MKIIRSKRYAFVYTLITSVFLYINATIFFYTIWERIVFSFLNNVIVIDATLYDLRK